MKTVDVLHGLAESVKAHEPDAHRYQIFQDKNEGPELVVIEQYVACSYTFQQIKQDALYRGAPADEHSS